jgi:DNA-directed RNA polymerase I and III subunit RPAC2
MAPARKEEDKPVAVDQDEQMDVDETSEVEEQEEEEEENSDEEMDEEPDLVVSADKIEIVRIYIRIDKSLVLTYKLIGWYPW